MSDSILEDPEFQAWAKEREEKLVPMIEQSAFTVSLVPDGPADIKFAVELGLSIMLDKPIIAVVQPGTRVPAKLVKVADVIVEGDVRTEEGRMAIATAVGEVIKRLDNDAT